MDYYQPVEINILSAQDLDSVNLLFRPTVYVSASVTRGSRDHQVTPAAVCGKKNLRWNYRMNFYIEDDKVQGNESVFVFQIKCKRYFGSDQVVGKLFLPVKQLLHLNEEKQISEHTNVNYQVITETGKPKGYICLGFRFGCVFKGQIRGHDSDSNVRANDGCRLGVWGIMRHEPSAPSEDDLCA
ncbi:unnamed protein product [Arabis nemorensis]|uniref:C2 domain-containing protein n=1 Tax=Arabis nemorensis TaxID=586526 RepID=A0A565B4P4_9BRAS|nr:unnamed protein product [Arabis nemorensis]